MPSTWTMKQLYMDNCVQLIICGDLSIITIVLQVVTVAACCCKGSTGISSQLPRHIHRVVWDVIFASNMPVVVQQHKWSNSWMHVNCWVSPLHFNFTWIQMDFSLNICKSYRFTGIWHIFIILYQKTCDVDSLWVSPPSSSRLKATEGPQRYF